MGQLLWKVDIPFYACDLMGTWAPRYILALMQEISSAHSKLLGVGREEMLKENIVWLISRIEVHMDKYPLAEEEIRVTTYPKNHRRGVFPRYYEFKNSNDKSLGRAAAIWMLVDKDKRKATSPNKIVDNLPQNRELPTIMPLPSRCQDISGVEENWIYGPLVEDIDINHHVNNTRYLIWLYNALGVEHAKKNVLSSFILNYNAEILPGETIDLALKKNEKECTLIGSKDGENYFEISAKFRERYEEEQRE